MRLDTSQHDRATPETPDDTDGTLTVNPVFADLFTRAGLTSPAAFVDLPGEVVSGHADRHVRRVELPVGVFYLKRQHAVGWGEKLRNLRAGFGWSSRCEREGKLLQELTDAGLPVPRWAAFGTHRGRAFLLVAEVPGGTDLRTVLSDNAPSLHRRCELAARIGATLARVHAAGFDTPDLGAKHVLVDRQTLALWLIDWQSATRGPVGEQTRAGALGALHASLAPELATRAERLAALRSYLAEFPEAGSPFVGQVVRTAIRHAGRRSVRDQLRPGCRQLLIWVAGEAVCAVPEVAADWPTPAVASPFYGEPPGVTRITLAEHDAILIRGVQCNLIARLMNWARRSPLRSPGVTIGRVLFHLQRYDIPAPRLLAFGQRSASAGRVEWFALYEPAAGMPLCRWRESATFPCRVAVGEVRECLRRLHAAGCVLTDPQTAFVIDAEGKVSVADPRTVRIVRRVSERARRRDERAVNRLLGVE
ncbi:MAG: lipopolysaccharide kinase InaA family protein [Gemmataceae bacterium]|nr:lipopolysaccharide kinase InaA family protein [Gemmataceae bacterium]